MIPFSCRCQNDLLKFKSQHIPLLHRTIPCHSIVIRRRLKLFAHGLQVLKLSGSHLTSSPHFLSVSPPFPFPCYMDFLLILQISTGFPKPCKGLETVTQSLNVPSSITCHFGGGWIFPSLNHFIPVRWHFSFSKDSTGSPLKPFTSIHVLILSLLGLLGTSLVQLLMTDFTETSEGKPGWEALVPDSPRAPRKHFSELYCAPPSE